MNNDDFSIDRTGKRFRRTRVGSALEQTIIVEAKSCLKGIIALADISIVVNRWVVTGLTRLQIVNSLLEIEETKSSDSDNKELNKHWIQRDKKDLKNSKQQICVIITPFRQRQYNLLLYRQLGELFWGGQFAK